jgi:hypothetical protein
MRGCLLLILIKLRSATIKELIEVFGRIVIGGATLVGACIAWENYKEIARNDAQTAPLVGYAKDQTAASQSFSNSAKDIPVRMADAVGKLNLQAGALADSASQASRLATDMEQANKNVIEEDRPWVGANFQVQDFEVGKKPIATVSFVNSGKRPAIATLFAIHGQPYEHFPDPEREYVYDSINSTVVIVPGGNSTSREDANLPLDQPLMDKLTAGTLVFYAFAKVEYTDPVTKDSHWTHACWRYIPNTSKNLESGFRNCKEYNETDDGK